MSQSLGTYRRMPVCSRRCRLGLLVVHKVGLGGRSRRTRQGLQLNRGENLLYVPHKYYIIWLF